MTTVAEQPKERVCRKCNVAFIGKRCYPCAKRTTMAWRLKNKDKVAGYVATYQAANMESIKAYKKAYNETHRQERIDYHSAYYIANKKRMAEQSALNQKLNAHRVNAANSKYRASKLKATPSWADEFIINEIYELASMRTKATGLQWEVDHIVPLRSKLVCGLHCETNMQLLTKTENASKGNLRWPDMP